jgi:uncharacterized protein with PIN domain
MRCDRLFWRGTHWKKLTRELDAILVETAKMLC